MIIYINSSQFLFYYIQKHSFISKKPNYSSENRWFFSVHSIYPKIQQEQWCYETVTSDIQEEHKANYCMSCELQTLPIITNANFIKNKTKKRALNYVSSFDILIISPLSLWESTMRSKVLEIKVINQIWKSAHSTLGSFLKTHTSQNWRFEQIIVCLEWTIADRCT